MKILFSPVGVNDPYKEERDPVTNSVIGVQEGPLLQICRQEQPDKVYLYFSGDAPMLEQQDRRFHNALEQLSPAPEVQVILRLDVKDDASAEFLREDFRSILTDIRDQAPAGSELIVNVFSGTDAMREAFTALAGECAQEPDPDPVVTEDDDDELPPDFFDGFGEDEGSAPIVHLTDDEEIAEDPEASDVADAAAVDDAEAAEEEAEDAVSAEDAAESVPEAADAEPEVITAPDETAVSAECAEASAEPAETVDAPAEPETPAVDPAALIADEQKKLLTILIDAHEYAAAQALCLRMDQPPAPAFTALLDAAVLRSSGRWPAAVQRFRDLGQADLVAGITPASDYYLRLNMLAERDDCTAFFRAVPALLVEVFLAVIRKQFGNDLTQYMIYNSRKWDENKLVMAQLTGKFNETFTYHTKPRPMKVGGFVTTAHLSNYMENVSDRKKHSAMILETMKLRQYAEDKVKNVTTYALSSVSGADMKKFNLFPPAEIITMIRDYIRNYTDLALDDDVMMSYQKMNEALKAALE